jgi:hypothetical protein
MFLEIAARGEQAQNQPPLVSVEETTPMCSAQKWRLLARYKQLGILGKFDTMPQFFEF